MFLSRSGLDLSRVARCQQLAMESDEHLQRAKRAYHAEPTDENRAAYAGHLRRSGDESRANHLEITEPYHKLAQARADAQQRVHSHYERQPHRHASPERHAAWNEKLKQLAGDLTGEGGAHDKMEKFLTRAREAHGHDVGRHLRPYDGQRAIEHVHDLVASSSPDYYGHNGVSSREFHHPPQDQETDNDNDGNGHVEFHHTHDNESRTFADVLKHHYPNAHTYHAGDDDKKTGYTSRKKEHRNHLFYNYKGPFE